VDAHICEHCGDGITGAEVAQYHTAKYEDIISIQSSRWGVIGLRMDGTLALPGTDFPYYRELSQWTDIIHICAGKYSMWNDNETELFFGVKSDGTVVSAGEGSDSSLYVDNWTEIVCVKSSGAHVIGLKADGTVLAEGNNRYNQCRVQNWTDVIDIQVGSLQSFGLKADGSVLAMGYDSSGGIGKISQWRNVDILDQSNLSGWPVAIQKEGTFLGQWHRDEIYSDAAAVISAGYAEPDHFVVLRKDGTLWGDPVDINSRAAGWKDIQIPYMPDVPVGRIS
jgi:alpha-tubulin suppressor-like RCC1 family protein